MRWVTCGFGHVLHPVAGSRPTYSRSQHKEAQTSVTPCSTKGVTNRLNFAFETRRVSSYQVIKTSITTEDTMQIAIIDKSKKVSTPEILLMVAACNRQLKYHACPAWNRSPSSVVFCEKEEHLAPGAFPIYIFDKADTADAYGYHDVGPDGNYYGRVFANPVLAEPNGSILSGPMSISCILSHEVLELFGDPQCNLWATGAGGVDYAVELCDPCEGDSYDINVAGTQVAVSNFILPHWFAANPPKGAKFDYMGKLTAPGTLTEGGYVLYFKEGAIKSKYGAKILPWRLAGKDKGAARSRRRVLLG